MRWYFLTEEVICSQLPWKNYRQILLSTVKVSLTFQAVLYHNVYEINISSKKRFSRGCYVSKGNHLLGATTYFYNDIAPVAIGYVADANIRSPSWCPKNNCKTNHSHLAFFYFEAWTRCGARKCPQHKPEIVFSTENSALAHWQCSLYINPLEKKIILR